MPLRLVQHLVAQRRLTEEAGQSILQAVAQPGAAVDTVLLERELVPELDLLESLGSCSGLRPVHLGDFEPNAEVAHTVPVHIAERWCVTPLSVDGTTLHVASGYPVARKELEEMGVLLGRPLELWVATELRVRDWISHVYGVPLSPRLHRLLLRVDPARASLHPPLPEDDAQADSGSLVEPTTSLELEVDVELDAEPASGTTSPVPTTGASGSTAPAPVGASLEGSPVPPAGERPSTTPSAPTSSPEPTVSPPAETVAAGGRVRAAPWLPPSLQAAVERGEDISDRLAAAPMAAQLAWAVPPRRPSAPGRAGAPTRPAAPTPAVQPSVLTEQDAPPQELLEPSRATPVVVPPEPPKSLHDSGASAPHLPPRNDVGTRGPERADAAHAPTAPAPTPLSPQNAAPTSAPEFGLPPEPGSLAASGSTPAERSLEVPGAQDGQTTAASAEESSLSSAPQAATPPHTGAGSEHADTAAAHAEDAAGTTSAQPELEADGEHASAATSSVGGAAGTVPAEGASPSERAEAATEAPSGDETRASQATADTPVAAVEHTARDVAPVDDTPDWTLAQAQGVLREHARDREALIRTVLRYAGTTFSFAAVFAIRRGEAACWAARGAEPNAPPFEDVRIPLDAPSLFRTVNVTRGSYVGGLPADGNTGTYLESFGRSAPRAIFLYPVEVRGRPVALVYGDNAGRPISQRRLSDFVLFCQELPGAFQQLLLQRRQRTLDTLPPEPAAIAARESGETPPPVLSAAPSVLRGQALGWERFDHGDVEPSGRAASLPPVLPAIEYVPSDFTPLLRRLTGPDAAARLRAVAELARTPDTSARVLARAFPGPSAWSRVPVGELPEAEELGPIPGALARLGRAGAGALASLLDADDPEVRYLALLTAGSLPYPVLVDGILRGLFDFEPDLSSAARAAAFALRRVPRMEASLPALRRELIGRDPLRRSLAARALGTLHDRAAVDGLINLTGSDDELSAQAAAEALREITRAGFGQNRPAWTRWWAENRGRRRSEWLVAALRAGELDLRLAAFEELSAALGETFDYQPEGPPEAREAAIRMWEAALRHPRRARRLAAL